MGNHGLFEPEQAWPTSECEDCFFYHSIDFPDGTSVEGHWDIRGRFDTYIGQYPVAGKTVLDVGTATGFLAFSAEAAGARVTALDVRGSEEFRRIPFRDSLYHLNRTKWIVDYDVAHLHAMKRGFWHAWHKLNSTVEVIYAPLDMLHAWDRRFDVVLAGAIIEHIADPISAIGALARLADEAVIIPFTEVVDSEEWTLHAIGDLSNPALDFLWWKLSRGLYYQTFANLGFSIEIVPSAAIYNPGGPKEFARQTIIARSNDPSPTRQIPLDRNTTLNDATAQFEQYLSFKTPRQQWSYALAIRCPPIIYSSHIEIEAKIESGKVGFGLNNTDLTEYLTEEKIVGSDEHRQLIRIPVTGSGHVPLVLIVRNVGENGECASGVIYSAIIRRTSS